jgi:cell division protein FtsB
MTVRVNANLGAATVDQLREQKKEMHLASARLLADEVKQEVEQLAASVESLERKKHDLSAHEEEAFQQFSAKIYEQCDAIVERHRNTPAVDYVNDYSFRSLVSEILNMKSWAKEKWQLWLKDESKYMIRVINFSLLDCHRQWVSYLRKRLRDVGSDSDEKPSLCIELLRSKGLIKAAAHGEENAEGEDLIVAAGADGWSAEDVRALLMAGADVATADENGRTGVWAAASCGNVSTLKALLAVGGDVNTCCNESEINKSMRVDGASALFVAATNGQTDCVVELIASKADVLQCDE